MLQQSTALPPDFSPDKYTLFSGTPERLLTDGDSIDLGGRTLRVLHTPGHSPGHMCFWEEDRGWLFTGDLVYKGTLFAHYPSTDPADFLRSVTRLASLPVCRIFPGHHSLDIAPSILAEMQCALLALQACGKLCHGSGLHRFGDWAIQL